MKKLMIALTAVAVAAVTQAASISWTTGSAVLCDSTGQAITAAPDGTTLALVVMDTATDWANATEIGTSASATTGKTTLKISTKTTSKGQVTGTVTFTYGGAGEDLVNNGQYLALMYKDKDGLHQLSYVTEGNPPVNAAWKIEGIVAQSTNLSGKDFGMTGKFTTASVPEPTSALLLVLGVAGLALRRRHA